MSPHLYLIDVRWGEMDSLGHVNNAVYLQYFEAARIQWISQLGHVTGNPQDGPVVLQNNCSYYKPVVYPCALRVETSLTKVGNTSFTLKQCLVGMTDELLYTEAEVVCVWVDRTSGRPLTAPDFLRSQLANSIND